MFTDYGLVRSIWCACQQLSYVFITPSLLLLAHILLHKLPVTVAAIHCYCVKPISAVIVITNSLPHLLVSVPREIANISPNSLYTCFRTPIMRKTQVNYYSTVLWKTRNWCTQDITFLIIALKRFVNGYTSFKLFRKLLANISMGFLVYEYNPRLSFHLPQQMHNWYIYNCYRLMLHQTHNSYILCVSNKISSSCKD